MLTSGFPFKTLILSTAYTLIPTRNKNHYKKTTTTKFQKNRYATLKQAKP
jgi:hypothetical protein